MRLAAPPRGQSLDQVCQLPRRLKEPVLAVAHNCSRKPPGIFLAAVFPKNLCQRFGAPGIDQVTSSASEVARALGTANSTEALRAKAQQLKDVVDQNANALQDKAGEARARAQNLSARIETAVPVVVGRFDTSTDDIGDRLHLKRWTFDRKGKLL